MDLEETTYTVPKGCDAEAMLDLCTGYDNRIAKYIDHAQFFDKVELPIDIARAEASRKELEEKKKAGVVEESSDFSWDSSKKLILSRVKGLSEIWALLLQPRKALLVMLPLLAPPSRRKK